MRSAGSSGPGETVFAPDRIAAAVSELADELRGRLAGEAPTFLLLLKGAVRFGCDLMRAWSGPCGYDFIGVSSYGKSTSSSGRLEYYHWPPSRELIDGRAVVLVDDICDSGATLGGVAARLRTEFTPRRLLTCVLILREGAACEPDLWGIRHPGGEFLVGYGLGEGENYRWLEAIAALDGPR